MLGFKCGQCGYKTANKDLYHDHMQSHKPAAQSSQDLVNEDTNGSVISEAVALNDGIITIQERIDILIKTQSHNKTLLIK